MKTPKPNETPNASFPDDDDHYDGQMRTRRLILGLPDDAPNPPPEKPTKDQPLKGNYFYSFKNGERIWQGVILRQWADYVLVLTFDWLMGNPSRRYLLKISELVWNDETTSGFYLFGDHASFLQEGIAHAAKQGNIRPCD
jgi:hypothetical protein